VEVTLRSIVTETGTLELTAVATKSDERWKVEFDIMRGNS